MMQREEIDKLAKTLVGQGLAASYEDGIKKAQQVLGIREVIDKKRTDFLDKENKEEKTVVSTQARREDIINNIQGKMEMIGKGFSTSAPVEKRFIRPIERKVVQKEEPVIVNNVKPEYVPEKVIKAELTLNEVVKDQQTKLNVEDTEKKEKSKKEEKDEFAEEKKIDISEVFNFGKR